MLTFERQCIKFVMFNVTALILVQIDINNTLCFNDKTIINYEVNLVWFLYGKDKKKIPKHDIILAIFIKYERRANVYNSLSVVAAYQMKIRGALSKLHWCHPIWYVDIVGV